MDGAALGKRRGSIDRRADQRMPEADLGRPDADQPVLLCALKRREIGAEPPRRSRHCVRLAGVVSGRDQQRQPRLFRQPADTVREQALDTRGHRQRLRQRLAPASCSRVSSGASSTTASALPPLADAMRRATSGATAVPARAVRIASTAMVSRGPRRSSGSAAASNSPTGRKNDRDSVGLQTAGGERECLGRVAVHPLRVVDHAEERLVFGCLCEQCENSERHAIEVGRTAAFQRERGSERARLRRRQPLEQPEGRAQQLMQRCERQLASDSTPFASSTVMSFTPRRISSISADLPAPGSPIRTRQPLRRARASSSSARSCPCSASRPKSLVSVAVDVMNLDRERYSLVKGMGIPILKIQSLCPGQFSQQQPSAQPSPRQLSRPSFNATAAMTSAASSVGSPPVEHGVRAEADQQSDGEYSTRDRVDLRLAESELTLRPRRHSRFAERQLSARGSSNWIRQRPDI